MSEYIIYIDDSGTKEYVREGVEYNERGGNSRYFVYAGIVLTKQVSSLMVEKIIDLKKSYFGTADIEIKSAWLRLPQKQKKYYLDPFGLTDAQLTQFTNELYDLIASTDLKIIAVVVDKVHMKQKYGSGALDPPSFAYECLMQRLVQDCPTPHRVSVTMDDSSGKTPAGNKYTDNLKNLHGRLCKNGSRFVKGVSFSPLEPRVRFVNSALVHQVQVADIIAYNLFRQFSEHGEQWEQVAPTDDVVKLESYEWFERLEKKFRMGPGRRIQGYGVIKVPMLKRVHWVVDED